MHEWDQFFYSEVSHGAFSALECRAILEMAEALPEHRSVLHRHTGEQIRDSGIRWLYAEQGAGWVFDRINARVDEYNAKYWYDIQPIRSGQLTRYGVGQEYRNHVDIGAGPMSRRKISVSIELTDPESYEGGGLEVGGDRVELRRGDMALFSSMMLHRALPVTSGERWSLVCWILGEAPLR
jgi:PKHD-type hydroxylase